MNEVILMIVFDLPVVSKEDRRIYNKFKRTIHKMGFTMYQKSIYIRYIRTNKLNVNYKLISEIVTNKGNVDLFQLTKRQFDSIICLGNINKSILLDKEIIQI